MRRSAFERMMRRVSAGEGGCLLWTGAHVPKGYGITHKYDEGNNVVSVYVHRVSWEHHFGPIPDGMFVCHACDTPRCVNPDHLFLGTQAENMQDCIAKGRRPRSGNMKVADADIPRIKEMRACGVKCREIANEFGVSVSLISLLARDKTVRHRAGGAA